MRCFYGIWFIAREQLESMNGWIRE